ncbi:MAG: hypothetical protein AAF196_20620 [Planctomycetota bacterium]
MPVSADVETDDGRTIYEGRFRRIPPRTIEVREGEITEVLADLERL